MFFFPQDFKASRTALDVVKLHTTLARIPSIRESGRHVAIANLLLEVSPPVSDGANGGDDGRRWRWRHRLPSTVAAELAITMAVAMADDGDGAIVVDTSMVRRSGEGRTTRAARTSRSSLHDDGETNPF